MREGDHDQARAIEAAHPGWRAWRGVGETGWYARRELSSPPVVLKASTPEGLRAAIAARDSRQPTGGRMAPRPASVPGPASPIVPP